MQEEIRAFIINTFMFGKGDLKDDERLFESGIIDSIGFIKLLSFLEKTFNAPFSLSLSFPNILIFLDIHFNFFIDYHRLLLQFFHVFIHFSNAFCHFLFLLIKQFYNLFNCLLNSNI